MRGTVTWISDNSDTVVEVGQGRGRWIAIRKNPKMSPPSRIIGNSQTKYDSKGNLGAVEKARRWMRNNPKA